MLTGKLYSRNRANILQKQHEYHMFQYSAVQPLRLLGTAKGAILNRSSDSLMQLQAKAKEGCMVTQPC